MSTPRIDHVESSRKVTVSLGSKIGALEDREMLLAAERDEISYSALVEAQPRAMARLKALGLELLQIDGERDSLRAALRTAERKHLEAKSAETRAGEAKRAHAALDNDKKAAKVAAQLDASLASFIALYGEYAEIMGRQAILGASAGQHPINLNARRCLASILMDSPLKLEHLSPSLRRTFTRMHADLYSPRARSWAEQRLTPEAKTEEAA